MRSPFSRQRRLGSERRQRARPSAYASSRHAEISRRAAIKYGLAAGAGTALVACGSETSGLEDVSIEVATSELTNDPALTPATEPAPSPTDPPPSAPPTTPASTATDPETPATTVTPDGTTASAATALAAGTEMLVSFTYAQAEGGKNEAPYVAVWIEDADGALVQTVSLWYQQDPKGVRWLPDLRRWFSADEARIAGGGADSVDVISGPTRLPGQYAVAWNGVSDELGPMPSGDYFVCIESARERGPYSLIREQVTLDAQTLDVPLPDSNELVAASVSIA